MRFLHEKIIFGQLGGGGGINLMNGLESTNLEKTIVDRNVHKCTFDVYEWRYNSGPIVNVMNFFVFALLCPKSTI